MVASESAGLGICYIGALRNNPSEVSTVLDLPHDTYPVFGLCLGWPDQNPEVKPRLPIDVVLRENSYGIEEDGLDLGNYDEAVRGYYATRSSNQKSMSWSFRFSWPRFSQVIRLEVGIASQNILCVPVASG